jgi:isocitrate dehydrogenase
MTLEGVAIQSEQIIEIYNNFIIAGFDCIKTENLYTFDEVPGFSSVHG